MSTLRIKDLKTLKTEVFEIRNDLKFSSYTFNFVGFVTL